jgi:hypothetical protein
MPTLPNVHHRRQAQVARSVARRPTKPRRQ